MLIFKRVSLFFSNDFIFLLCNFKVSANNIYSLIVILSKKYVVYSNANGVANTPRKTVEQLAKEVLNGKWGNGAERKQRLSEAGYDYNLVQDKVNGIANNNQPTSTPKKSIEELAREVWSGKWGNGAERKQRLTEAGYDYNAVQAMVNKLYG